MTFSERQNLQADFSLVLSFEDARKAVENHAAGVRARGSETVDLLDALDRVLAEAIHADRDFPPFPRATRDGYAVRAADLATLPAMLNVIGEIKAGEKLVKTPVGQGPGETVAIMTGAPVPIGADAVVMVEYTSRRGERIEIAKAVAAGDNIVARGAEALEGSVLLDRGLRLNEGAIAVAASVGKARLEVFRKPRVAILSTGDELVGLEELPGPTEIRNSNTYSLAAQVKAAGGEPMLLPIAPDERARLLELIQEGLQADLLVLTGGVSMGRYDLVEQVLAEMHAEFFFTGAKIQPGRPAVFGRVQCGLGGPVDKPRACSARGVSSVGTDTSKIEPKYFFGLPGNPVSTMVTFETFARPMLEALAGMAPQKLRFVHAQLKSEIRFKVGLRRFLPAILSGEFDDSLVELVPWQGSGDIAAAARANCYIVISPDRECIAAGEFVAVMMCH